MNKLRIVFAAAMLCLLISVVYAITLTSNIVEKHVNASNLSLDVTPSGDISLGQSFTLTATISPVVPSKIISFWWNTTNHIGNAATDGSGIAAIGFIPTVIGTYAFVANCTYP